MHFKQFYLGCLAHASYLIGSEGEAAVVDPQRDVEIYLEEARQQGLAIRHVIETHLHADFVSGHRELAARAGARIYFGWQAGAKFEHVPVHDGDEIRIGNVVLRFLETPGHTPESISILVFNNGNSDAPEAVLTGDTLFIGDVGRPDLLGSKMSPEVLAGMLYDSLHGKLLKLPDDVQVFPAHGAGSMCGRNISNERSSTIGHERRFNYALREMSKEEFTGMMTVDLPEAPSYFGRDAEMNREGPPLLDRLSPPATLSPGQVADALKSGHTILDTRPAAQFGTGHIPGSLNIGLGGQFASWAGALIRPETPVIIVAEEEERVREAQTRLARVALDNIAGYLAGGVLAWNNTGLPLSAIEQAGVEEIAARMREDSSLQVLDVRRPPEWQAGHIKQAIHIPLNRLALNLDRLDQSRPVAAICAGGFRSSIATSILKQHQFERLTNVVGGMTAWVNAKFDVTE
ncbi:MAG TPA: rhodanese-like domain-containing protein [Anaerolineales bacterium]|jgi:glyoxylase-like metal-dependent hydrolase (beta-lactamase superfamily II)